MTGPLAARFADGRLHLQHGPIDLVIEAVGEAAEVEAAYAQATARFADILETLVAELPALRRPVGAAYPLLRGPVARRMAAAVWPHRAAFVTPMAAVAGAVADEMLAAMLAGRKLAKAYVNDGGDIAVHLAQGESFGAGVVFDPGQPSLDAVARLTAELPARGVATSGWRGRSFSLGVADAVTALATNAAAADAAATLIANAVNVDSEAVERRAAVELDPDSDLGALPVTVAVGALPHGAIDAALLAGVNEARRMLAEGLICGALLALRDRVATVGALPVGLLEKRA
jgi:ApbE superfamily uncharacterized protein (UPF0280 family)